MAAPRKYTDAQRSEIRRLHEAGMTSQQISDACSRGSATVASFEIPRRSVSAIVHKQDQEASVTLPTAPADAGSLEMVQRFPERIARILDAELDRLEQKQRRGKLTADDMAAIQKAAAVIGPLTKRLEGHALRVGGERGGALARGRGASEPESAIDKLAREEGEQKQASAGLGGTRISQEAPDSSSADPRPGTDDPAPGAPAPGSAAGPCLGPDSAGEGVYTSGDQVAETATREQLEERSRQHFERTRRVLSEGGLLTPESEAELAAAEAEPIDFVAEGAVEKGDVERVGLSR